ncbi:MAG: hypothetical protein V9G29_15410 [Burkholderiaceae bacterium]
MADATIRFFDHDCDQENSLDTEGRKLLEDLKARERRSDFTEDDEEFFVKHRRLLEQDAKLCSRWEKALYGKPIECNDFFDGFARVVQQPACGPARRRGRAHPALHRDQGPQGVARALQLRRGQLLLGDVSRA